MPLVTVYITNYNYGKYLQQAIESVLNQTFQDFEVIIIDDGSTDNSKQIIESYSDHEKVKIIFQKNKGLNITNNIALRVANGKYIMRLDADDYLDSNALLVMSNMLENNPELGLVYPDYYLVDAEGNIMNVRKRMAMTKEVSLPDQPAHGACTLIRTDFLKKIGGYDEEFSCQDGYHLWVNFVARYKIDNVDTPLFYYRQHGHNLTSNEDRILTTRSAIKDKFIDKNQPNGSTNIAILPVRGSKLDPKNITFKKLGGEIILDRIIEAALKAQKISKLVVSSPDGDIEKHIHKKYLQNKKILFHKRSADLARLNITLEQTIENVLEMPEFVDWNIENFLVLSIENPFITSKIIDDAINTLLIFKPDSLISVRPETDMLFQHHGGGMKTIFNQRKFTKLEREALYRYAGGIMATTKEQFKQTRQLISGKTGHIIIDQKAALAVRTRYDIEIAEFLAQKEKQSIKSV